MNYNLGQLSKNSFKSVTGWSTRIGIVGYGALLVMTVLALTAARPGYHARFYDIYPAALWASLALSVVAGLSLIFSSAMTIEQEGSSSNAWMYGICLVFASYAVFFVLPRLSGLPLWAPPNADLLAHLADSKSILRTGTIVGGDVYPAMHVWVAEIALVTGLPIDAFQWLVGYVYTGVFALGCALYARRLFGSRAGLFTLAASCIFLFEKYNQHQVPWLASFALIPLVLVLVDHYRRRGTEHQDRLGVAVGYIVLGSSIALYHPMTALVLFAVLMTVVVATHLYRWRIGSTVSAYRPTWILIIPLVHGVWYVFTLGLDRFVAIIAGGIISGSVGGATRAGRAGSSGYTTEQLITRFVIGDFGVLLLVAGVGGLFSLAIVYRYIRKTARPGEVTVVCLFAFGVGLAGLLLAAPLVVGGPYRINQVTLFASVLAIGHALSQLSNPDTDSSSTSGVLARFDRRRWRTVGTIVLCAVVLVAATGSLFTVYDETDHVTPSEFAGTDWFLTHYDSPLLTKSRNPTPKISAYVRGQKEATQIGTGYQAFPDDSAINDLPRRLGYGSNESIRGTLRERGGESVYVITRQRDMEWLETQPPNRYPYIDYYSEADLARLRNDPAANRVYDNEGFVVWVADPNSRES